MIVFVQNFKLTYKIDKIMINYLKFDFVMYFKSVKLFWYIVLKVGKFFHIFISGSRC
jgi:hypothetical protein